MTPNTDHLTKTGAAKLGTACDLKITDVEAIPFAIPYVKPLKFVGRPWMG